MSELEKDYLKALESIARTPGGKRYARKVGKIHGLAKHEIELYIKQFEAGAGDVKIPNLDAMSSDDLMSFWAKYRFHTKKNFEEIFPGWPRRDLGKTMSALAAYASNKATEKSCRRRGDKQAAEIYEKISESIYRRLPDFAKFRKTG